MPTLLSTKHNNKSTSISNPENYSNSPQFENNAESIAQNIIQLRSVTKIYPNESIAFLNVNLEIQAGELLFITGPSGSGKSTFLKLLYGDEFPTQGEVIVDGNDVASLRGDCLSRLRRRIGIVFQDYKLIHQRTVAENISFVLQAQGYTRKEIQRRLEPTLKLVGLLSKANCFPTQLSGGEQQRVTIARAIVGTPPIILADEPTGNLDPDNSWQVMQILKKLNSFGATVIITTHDEHLVRRSHNSVVQIKNGTIYRQ
ncbi:MAG: cell division ATP-binding protein FtsE [Cyanobacteria bacterium P01_A01_bin.84]